MDAQTKENVLNTLRDGRPIATARKIWDCVPTIHEFHPAEHMGFGFFYVKNGNARIDFNAGGAMYRGKHNGEAFSWTPVSGDWDTFGISATEQLALFEGLEVETDEGE